MAIFSQQRKQSTNDFLTESTQRPITLGSKTFLSKITPDYEYIPIDDGLKVDDQVKYIIHIYSEFGRVQNLNPMWGLTFIRNIIKTMREYNNMNVVFINTIEAIDHETVAKAQDAADSNTNMSTSNKARNQIRLRQQREDLDQVARELEIDNAAYIDNVYKYIVTAESTEQFDRFYSELERQLLMAIPSLQLTTSPIPPLEDLRNILEKPSYHLGRRMKMTSTELAGQYNLVSAGIEDPYGLDCGQQIGDVNNSPVLWDMKDFHTQAIIASKNDPIRQSDWRLGYLQQPKFRDSSGVELWVNSFIRRAIRKDSQHENTRVFTMSLAPLTLSDSLIPITSSFDMANGYINPFEMFGERNKDEKIAFENNLVKWEVMFRQLYRMSVTDQQASENRELKNSVITRIKTILEELYVHNNMWTLAKNGGQLGYRNLGVPHETVPTLDDFIEQIGIHHLDAESKDQDLENIEEIQALAYQLRRSQMFGNHTSPQIDTIKNARHVHFDFSRAGSNRSNTQLLQFITGFSAIVTQAEKGDIVIIHGADRVVSLTQAYIRQEIDQAIERGVRFLYTYGSVKSMLQDVHFNEFNRADYMLTGCMDDADTQAYDEILGSGKLIPASIKSNITVDLPYRYYLRRGYTHVCFNADQAV